ncbi:MBL fold metallo-hydrolase [Paenibacillus albidus]|uniref:MBL fold metallo-hydrolase n=1 Tax=Paenibacillus albidus TaxID=2041023 RepID=UPI001BEA7E7F|nr:MBL fold metallo-hydrolase [Paenibacillus albidus]MBT2289431.1 MBL fold metallo-hydrolase [Paenibacillus albidus]
MNHSEQGIHQVRLPLPMRLNHVNSYLIEDEEGWSVIDPGLATEDTLTVWADVMKRYHLTFGDIRRIIVTHYHPDHYGLAGSFQQWSGAAVYSSRETFEWADRTYHSESIRKTAQFNRKCGVPASLVAEMSRHIEELFTWVKPVRGDKVILEPEEEIQLGQWRFQVKLGSGHAEGSIGFLHQASRMFIGGDLLLEKITPNITYDYSTDTDPLKDYFDTLNMLRTLHIQSVLPGHGPLFQLSDSFIDRVIEHHLERLQEIRSMWRHSNTREFTPYEISTRLFPKVVDSASLSFALGETVAHLRYLQNRNELVIIERDDALFCRYNSI